MTNTITNSVTNSVAGDPRLPFHARVFETPNLMLRAFREEDIDPLYAIMRDAEAMRYTYKAPSREHCVERLRAYAEQATTLGYAPWTVVQRAQESRADGKGTEGHVIGWGGLNIDPFDPGWGTEVAYCFHPNYWGRGYGTELVRTALEVGFGALSMQTIVAFAHEQNIGSIRVLEKCGFQFLRYEPQLDRNHYAIEQTDW